MHKIHSFPLVGRLHELIRWIKERYFQAIWVNPFSFPFPGKVSICPNWIGTSLICVSTKTFQAILRNCFSVVRERHTRPNEMRVPCGGDYLDRIFTLCRVLEHRYKFQQLTVLYFIDFRTVFDQINHESLWGTNRDWYQAWWVHKGPKNLLFIQYLIGANAR